jgi:hypothetical protein
MASPPTSSLTLRQATFTLLRVRAIDMASWSAIGSGSHALTAGTELLFVDINTLPAGVSSGNANPTNYYGVGLVRVGFHGSYRHPVPVDSFTTLIDIPSNADVVAWSVFPDGALTFTEFPSGATPPPGGFILDTFTDTDDTLLVDHTPDTGGAWASPDNDLVILGNKATTNVFGDCHDFNLAPGPDDGNYTVEADVVMQYDTHTQVQLWSRWQSGTNGYIGQLDGDGGIAIKLGLFTNLVTGTFGPPVIGTSYHLSLRANGVTLTLSIDGTVLLTTTDTTYASGGVGIGISGGNEGPWTIDNLQATPPS